MYIFIFVILKNVVQLWKDSGPNLSKFAYLRSKKQSYHVLFQVHSSPKQMHIDLIQFSQSPWVTEPDLGSCQNCQMVFGVLHKRPHSIWTDSLNARTFDKFDMTLVRVKWPRIITRTGWNQCTLLLEKSVCRHCCRELLVDVEWLLSLVCRRLWCQFCQQKANLYKWNSLQIDVMSPVLDVVHYFQGILCISELLLKIIMLRLPALWLRN